MKAIIPVAGVGKKLRPHTYTQPKALIPIAGMTILSINIEQLRAAGITEFIFVIGYLGEKIQDYVTEKFPDIKAHFVKQDERLGTAHAVALTEPIVGNEEVIIILGDVICEYDAKELFHESCNVLGVKKVDDPRNFGIATFNEHNMMIDILVEKPEIPRSNYALVGIYVIRDSKQLFESCKSIYKNQNVHHTDGEYNLTDALNLMIQHKCLFKAFKINNWYDCGKIETIIETNAFFLKKFYSGILPEPTHPFINTVLIPPISIHPSCEIKNAIIGPYVTIESKAIIEHSIITNSIVGSYSNIVNTVLDNSLIGSDVALRGQSLVLNIGDNTEINLA
ncbi:MAG: sugar phosphate nucleotidyltransferase [Phycisphaerales bacterium]|nr:sugar phosphate nucleotidyltransferase [Phycisphaerales bacterium]